MHSFYATDHNPPPPAGPTPRLSHRRATLIFDVRAAVATLPPDLKAVAVALMRAATPAEVPRRAGLSRRCVQILTRQLADHLRPLDPRVRRVRR